MTKSPHSYLVCNHCHRHYFAGTQMRRCPHCGHRIRWSPKYLWVWVAFVIFAVLAVIAGIEIAGD